MAYRYGRSLKPFRRPWLWSLLLTAAVSAVVVFSLLPASSLQTLPSANDKLEHFTSYAVLAAGAVQLYPRWRSLAIVGLGLVLMGIALEYAQGAMGQGRMMDRMDALANTLGVIAGLGTKLTPWADLLLRLDRRDDAASR
jgi:VanZ family protein